MPEWLRGRIWVWLGIIVLPTWRWLVLVPLATLGAFQAIREELSAKWQERLELPNLIPHWPWWAWVLVLLVVVIIIILESAFQAIRRERTAAKTTDQDQRRSVGILDAGTRTQAVGNLFIGRGIGVQVEEPARDHRSERNIQVATDSLRKSLLPTGPVMGDDELDEECQQTKLELLDFVAERWCPLSEWPPSIPWGEYMAQSQQHSEDTRRLYLEKFAAKLQWLLEELRARGYYDDQIDIYNRTAFTGAGALEQTAIFLGAWSERKKGSSGPKSEPNTEGSQTQ